VWVSAFYRMKTLFRWSRLVVSFCILLSDWSGGRRIEMCSIVNQSTVRKSDQSEVAIFGRLANQKPGKRTNQKAGYKKKQPIDFIETKSSFYKKQTHTSFRSLFVLCTFSFGHCVICSSSIYGFWLPLWLSSNSSSHPVFGGVRVAHLFSFPALTDNTIAKRKSTKDKQRSTKHTHKTKDRVTHRVNSCASRRVSGFCFFKI
jgi:hypothetical protein